MDLSFGDFKIEMIEDNCRVCAHEKKGGFEPKVREFMLQAFKTHEAFIDAGAYTGIYTIAASLHGLKSYAFEPMPQQFEVLKTNAKKNSISNASIMNIALSNEAKGVVLGYSNTPLTSGAGVGLHGFNKLAVKSICLDNLGVANDAKILLKIDVEGHEKQVVQGGLQMISEKKPTIIVELLNTNSKNNFEYELKKICANYQLLTKLDKTNYVYTAEAV